MKKILSLALIFSFSLASFCAVPKSEECITFLQEEPFSLNPLLDTSFIASGLALYGSALLWKKIGTFEEYDTRITYDKSEVLAFDRWAMNGYNKTLDSIATATCAFNMVAPALVFTAEYFFSNLRPSDALTLSIMYAETMLWVQGIKDMTKHIVQRKRPYMYFNEKDEDALENGDCAFSFLSGHSANAFAGAAFVSYTFSSYYPTSKWKIPVVAASYSVAIATASLRMMSGNHFFTDVLAGAAMGTATALIVPLVHKAIAFNTNKKGLSVTGISPMGLSFCISF